MSMCPLCNALETREEECPNCSKMMEDRGRIMDYFGDYSAYMQIDGMKMNDGIMDDYANHQCPHVFYCTQCFHNKIVLIREK